MYLWYPLSSPAFRIMPETISPASGSKNLTPRIEPPKVEMNDKGQKSFTQLNSTRFPRRWIRKGWITRQCQCDTQLRTTISVGDEVRWNSRYASLIISPKNNQTQMDFEKQDTISVLKNIFDDKWKSMMKQLVPN